MTLATSVTNRYPASRLRQLTNPNDQDASSVNSTLLGLAATDIEAEFLEVTATAYDDSEAQHVAIAVAGVIAKLGTWAEAAGDAAQSRYDKWLERLEQLSKVLGRDRVTPKTKSVLTTSSEQTATEVVRPDTDRTDYDDLIPRPPA